MPYHETLKRSMPWSIRLSNVCQRPKSKPTSDRSSTISLRDFHAFWPPDTGLSVPVRQQVRAVLRAADMLSEPTAQEVAAVQAFEATHSPADQQHLLTTWRQLQLTPALSEIILRNREWE